MRRSIVSLLAIVAVCFVHSGVSRSQETSDKSATPAATRPAQPVTPARPAAEARKPAVTVDPTGSWKWDFPLPDDNTLELVLKLKWDGKKLEGNYTAFESTTKVEEGKLDKDALSFVVRPEFGGNQFEVKFNGKVAKDEIKGTIGIDFGEQPQEREWVAKRFVDVEDVVGVWDLTVEAPDFGEFESTLTVTKDNKGLHAVTASDFGEFEASKVEIKDNQLVFEMGGDNADFNFKIVYKGAPRGNTIEGKSEFDFGGNTGEMKFTGKRQPPKEEKKAEPARPAAPTRPAADDKKDSKDAAAATPKSSDK
ncbi:MAG: hypothetical protein WD669_04590 [Pirellulales bacterium]